MCNARRILLRREARDESSARNSVSCVTCNVTVLRYAVTLQVCTHLKPYHPFNATAKYRQQTEQARNVTA
jgi:hypothetical protein